MPDLEGKPFTFKVSLNVIKLGIVVAAVGLIVFIAIIVTWGSMMRRVSITDRLAEENAKYEQERQRVVDLETRVKQLQQFEDQIRRVLGSDYKPSRAQVTSQISEALSNGQPENPPVEPSTEPMEAPATASPTLSQFSDQSIIKGTGIPSLWPVEGFISRGFEWNPIVPDRSHSGIDIAGKEGTVVRAAADGIVVWTGWSAQYGNLVILAHSSGYYSVYGHNQVILVQPRQRVDRGTPICLLGNTGQSTAPHLHFEVWFGNQPIDPIPLLTTS